MTAKATNVSCQVKIRNFEHRHQPTILTAIFCGYIWEDPSLKSLPYGQVVGPTPAGNLSPRPEQSTARGPFDALLLVLDTSTLVVEPIPEPPSASCDALRRRRCRRRRFPYFCRPASPLVGVRLLRLGRQRRPTMPLS